MHIIWNSSSRLLAPNVSYLPLLSVRSDEHIFHSVFSGQRTEPDETLQYCEIPEKALVSPTANKQKSRVDVV